MRRTIVALSALCAMVACENEGASAARVDELRLLAVQADRPFAMAGDEVQLKALAFDPEARELTWAFGLCSEPRSSEAIDCLRTLSFDDLSVMVDSPTFRVRVPSIDTPYVGVAVVVCPGSIVSASTAGLPIACLDASGRALSISEFEVGLKRIFIQPSADNQNPAPGELLWDGLPWLEGEPRTDTCVRRDQTRCQEFASHSIELRQASAKLEFEAEQTIVQFYATAGEFDDPIRSVERGINRWRARSEDAGKVVTFWIVLRDNRGGVSWVSRQLRLP